MTAIEWLADRLVKIDFEDDPYYRGLFNIAMELEKRQIIDAYKSAEDKYEFFEYEHRYGREYLTAEPYYYETFKKINYEQ